MRRWLTALFGVVLGGCSNGDASTSAAKLVQTEHGWRTDRVEATRYRNTLLGQVIALNYLTVVDDSIADTDGPAKVMSDHGCFEFEGGGSPFATYWYQCKGVTDPASADAKIKQVLPVLTAYLEHTNG